MTLSSDENDYPILDFMDFNQPSQVTGYNVYRSSMAVPLHGELAPGTLRAILRQACRFCAAVLLAAAGCPGRSAPGPAGPARHVVFISLDTTRPDHLGCYGNPTVRTPNIDRLAAGSIVLDDFVTVATTTLASHAALFTGKYPHTHGTPRNGFVINGENVLLPELLHDQGFVTAGFVGSFALERRFGLDQGFDHYDDRFEQLTGVADVMQNERSAAAVTDAALEYLGQHGVPPHLFLFVHYFDAHAPYAAPAPYDTLYDPRGRAELPGWKAAVELCQRDRAAEAVRRTALQYAGEISYLDQHLGRLLDGLAARGILDDALVVVTSDHGEQLAEPRTVCFDHGWDVYQATARVVGIVRLPQGRNGGRRLASPLANIDILPTVLGYLGLTPPAGVEGRAFDLERLLELPAADRARFCEATKPAEQAFETDPRWTNMLKPRAILEGRYKFVQLPYAGQEELYDLAQDPQEQHELLAAGDPAVRDLAARLRVELEAWAGAAHPLPSHFVISQRDEALERLKALGYVGR